MSRKRGLVVAVGVAAAAGGVALVAVPGLANAVPVDAQLVAVVGALALVQGVRDLQRWRRSDRQHGAVDAAETEDVQTGPVPGADFDELVERAGETTDPRAAASRREQLDRRLGRAAVAALRRRHGHTEAEARERLAAGTWTDDPAATAYFAGGDGDDDGAGLLGFVPASRSERTGRRAARAADEIAAIVGSEGDRE